MLVLRGGGRAARNQSDVEKGGVKRRKTMRSFISSFPFLPGGGEGVEEEEEKEENVLKDTYKR